MYESLGEVRELAEVTDTEVEVIVLGALRELAPISITAQSRTFAIHDGGMREGAIAKQVRSDGAIVEMVVTRKNRPKRLIAHFDAASTDDYLWVLREEGHLELQAF